MHSCRFFRTFFACLLLLLPVIPVLAAGEEPPPTATAPPKDQAEEKAKKAPVQITEEIVVTATVDNEAPVATTSLLDRATLEQLTLRDLSQAMSYVSGTFVSSGAKSETGIRIRGLDTQKVTLMIDGVPLAEPYFNSFSLNTITTEAVSQVRVVKGASSVLYGANALGGVLDVTTRRPDTDFLECRGTYGSFGFLDAAVSGGFRRGQFAVFGAYLAEDSGPYDYPVNGEDQERKLSDYGRQSFDGKFYVFPTETSEILASVSYYTAAYGVPPATAYSSARYWRFKDWDRLMLGLGGTFGFAGSGVMKAKMYYTRHFNVLDAYRNSAMDSLQWESTYRNETWGGYLNGAVPLFAAGNELQFSANYRYDSVNTQSALTAPWERYQHETVSVGAEDHYRLTDQWLLVGGVSVDHLRKTDGRERTTANPLAGVVFSPTEVLDLHVTFSQKSRFPSMKSLYSTSGGNPDLRDERGTSTEVGATWRGWGELRGTVFYNRIKDLIETVRLPDSTRVNVNIGKSRITGFELEFKKELGWASTSVNYTFLDGDNLETDTSLDMVPTSQFNAVVSVEPAEHWFISAWGMAVSRCQSTISNARVDVPGYALINAEGRRELGPLELFVRVENLLDHAYATEPGYPMPGRAFLGGVRFSLRQEEK